MRGIYIVQTSEFVRRAEPVFKAGRTDDLPQRMEQYPKGSKLVYFQQWKPASHDSLVAAKTAVLRALRANPAVIQRHDLGSEYFEADPAILTALVHDCISKQKQLFRVPDAPTGMAENAVGSGASSIAVAVDPDIAVLEFVKLNESQLTGSTVTSVALYERFNEHIKARGERVALRYTDFARRVIAATGACTIVTRNGIVVERSFRFPTFALTADASPASQLDAAAPPAAELDAREPPAAELDAREPPAAELDAREPLAAELDAREPPAAELDAREPPAAELDAREPPAAELDAAGPPVTGLDAAGPPVTGLDAREPSLL
jgi:hypothetical protein